MSMTKLAFLLGEENERIINEYREIIMYLVFGVLTTVVNIVVYFLSAELLHINYLISNALAWFLSVLFAYITNRKYVLKVIVKIF